MVLSMQTPGGVQRRARRTGAAATKTSLLPLARTQSRRHASSASRAGEL